MSSVLRRVVAAATLVIATAAGVLVAAPASAAPPALEFSRDGVSWSTSPLASVFTSEVVLVPGGSASQMVYVRNLRSTPTSVVAVVTDISVDDLDLGAGLTLATTDFGMGGFGAMPISDVEKCAVIAPRRDLAPGDVLAVRLDIALASWLTGGQGQAGTADFRLLVGAADRTAPVTPEGCPSVAASIPLLPGTASEGRIAATGATPPYAALSVAGFALGVGWILIVAARRRRKKTA